MLSEGINAGSIKVMITNIILQIVFILIAIFAIAFLIVSFATVIISNAHGAPYVPVSRKVTKRLLEWGGVSSEDIFCDLGCGDARLLISAVRDFGVKKAVGYEIAPWPYMKARLLLMVSGLKDRIKILHRNIFNADLGDASFVYLYLMPKTVDRLAIKMSKELSLGAKVLCISFPIELDRHPEFKLLKSEKLGKITAYLYGRI
ncbi:MAG TPA: class I SAM-dependent methyltransferase [Candidatus Paceibacterota bacterium]